MKFNHAKFLVTGAIGLLSGLSAVRAQEAEPTVLKPATKDFLFFADGSQYIRVPMQTEGSAYATKTGAEIDSISISLKSLSTDVKEFPEVKLECLGKKYVVPARKIIVVPPEPKKQGIFVQSALDPNGTGNYEILLTINWSDWPDSDKRIKLLAEFFPDTLEVIGNAAGWSNPKGGIAWTATIILHNGTGRPFVLDTGYFENLPTTEGFPAIEIPPAN